MRLIASFVLCAAIGGAQPSASRGPTLESPSTRRHALLIGNARYARYPLVNPVNDARAIAQVMREVDFDVKLSIDTNKRAMREAIDNFVDHLRPEDVGLFYYAGHGFQIEGESYLMPVDFEARDAADARDEGYSVSRVIAKMEASGARLNIVILDACRSNSFSSTRSVSGGLASVNTGAGTFVAFATAPGKTALDNPKEKNGLFTSYLLEALKVEDLSLDEVFNRTRENVYHASNRDQLPWTGSSVIGQFYFRVKSGRPTIAPPSEGPSLLKIALDFRAAGKFRESLDAFARAIQRDPMDVRALFERGKLNASMGRYESAIADFKETIRLQPDHALAYHARGVAYLSKGDYASAISDFDRAAERLPRDATVFFNRGIAYASLSRQQQALESYNQALDIRPDYAEALANRAIAYALSGKLQQALEDCNQAIRVKPSLAQAYRNRAEIKRQLGDAAGATADDELARKLK
jgi:tetratricopeptide (TPR) repeat protein